MPLAIARFCYHTGWRTKSEAFLKWAQVDWAGGFVRLEPGTPKNREGRAFPITPPLRAILERRLDFTPRCERSQGRIIPWVFHRKGEPIQKMSGSWRTACRAAGVPGRIMHDLRWTAVRNLERAGVSRSVAMKTTGHKTESVYRRYDRQRGGSAGGGREARRHAASSSSGSHQTVTNTPQPGACARQP